MYHVFVAIQCIYGYSEGIGENRDWDDGSEISGGGGV